MSNFMTIDALKPFFGFPFQGADWRRRFFIGAGLILAGTFIPIIPWIFVCGYIVQVMRRTIEGEDLILPEWDDLGALGVDGLRFGAVSFIYLLPGFLVYVGGIGLYMVSAMAMPIFMQMAEHGHSGFAAVPFFFLASVFIMLISIFLGMLLTLIGAIPLPVATGHFVARDQLSAAFRIREWWALLWRNKLGYFIAWIIFGGLLGAWYLGTMLLYSTMVFCCLIPMVSAPLLFYIMLVWAAIFGEMYRESRLTHI